MQGNRSAAWWCISAGAVPRDDELFRAEPAHAVVRLVGAGRRVERLIGRRAGRHVAAGLRARLAGRRENRAMTARRIPTRTQTPRAVVGLIGAIGRGEGVISLLAGGDIAERRRRLRLLLDRRRLVALRTHPGRLRMLGGYGVRLHGR